MQATKMGIKQLSWLSGTWTGQSSSGVMDEHWSSLSGNSMVGTCRVVLNDKISSLEFLKMEQQANGDVLLDIEYVTGMKTFHFKLTRSQSNEAVFESYDPVKPLERLTYRLEEGNRLAIRLEKHKDGKLAVIDEFALFKDGKPQGFWE